MGLFKLNKRRKQIEIPPPPPLSEKPSITSIKKINRPISNEEDVDMYEEKTINSVQRELDSRESLELTKPIFVEYEHYKGIVDEISQTKIILKEQEDTLFRTEDFNELEDSEFKQWQKNITDIMKKLVYVDKTLFGK